MVKVYPHNRNEKRGIIYFQEKRGRFAGDGLDVGIISIHRGFDATAAQNARGCNFYLLLISLFAKNRVAGVQNPN
jgi:hypothetical protein